MALDSYFSLFIKDNLNKIKAQKKKKNWMND